MSLSSPAREIRVRLAKGAYCAFCGAQVTAFYCTFCGAQVTAFYPNCTAPTCIRIRALQWRKQDIAKNSHALYLSAQTIHDLSSVAILSRFHLSSKWLILGNSDESQHFTKATLFSPSMAQQPPVGQGLLTVEASRSHSGTPHSVGLLWTSDQPHAETPTWQHTALTRDRHPCPRRDSNPQSQQANCRRPTPYSARPLGPAESHSTARKCWLSRTTYT
jgi:hypothetical protein